MRGVAMRDAMARREWVPWDRPAELAVWAIALIVATFFIHNFVRAGKKRLE